MTEPKALGIEGLKAANSIVAQVITVSAALLAFTVTFLEKFTPDKTTPVAPWPLKACWVLLVIAILFGFWTLMGIAGTLNEIDRGRPETNPQRTNITFPAWLMISAFVCGLGFLIASGGLISGATSASPEPHDSP